MYKEINLYSHNENENAIAEKFIMHLAEIL